MTRRQRLRKDFGEQDKNTLPSRDSPPTGGEGSKLVHSDDFRNKIVHEGARFQDKTIEKESKLISDTTERSAATLTKHRQAKPMHEHGSTERTSVQDSGASEPSATGQASEPGTAQKRNWYEDFQTQEADESPSSFSTESASEQRTRPGLSRERSISSTGTVGEAEPIASNGRAAYGTDALRVQRESWPPALPA